MGEEGGNACTFAVLPAILVLPGFCLAPLPPPLFSSFLQGGFGDEERNAIRTAHGADDDHQVAGGVSPVYGPPEVLNDEEQQASPSFPKKWDVYSYAALMYEVFAGEGYFQDLKVRVEKREEEKTNPSCRVRVWYQRYKGTIVMRGCCKGNRKKETWGVLRCLCSAACVRIPWCVCVCVCMRSLVYVRVCVQYYTTVSTSHHMGHHG